MNSFRRTLESGMFQVLWDKLKQLLPKSYPLVVYSFAVVTLAACSAGASDVRYVNISEGYASKTLKDFAKQAEVEIIFNAPTVADIKTNKVMGEMAPSAALEAMLLGTPLFFERDIETGAYAVALLDVEKN